MLAPDGSVLVAGGRVSDAGDANPRTPPDMEILEPPYLTSTKPRPVLLEAPPVITSDTEFTITLAPDAAAADELVLVAFGSTVQGNDPSQRLVEMKITGGGTPGGGPITATAPPASWAPEGRYLLFALSDRIPSEGRAIELRNDARDEARTQ
jgi:hypothetical protein